MLFHSHYYSNPQPLSKYSVVLDLDETLVHSYADDTINQLNSLGIYSNPNFMSLRQRTYFLNSNQPLIGEYTYIWGIKRPYTEYFLNFCFSYFQSVIIWSAGSPVYVPHIVDMLFIDLPAPHKVYTIEQCEDTRYGDYHKPLRKLINQERHLNLSLEHLLIIDDKWSNMLENTNNGIVIPPYSPIPNINQLAETENDTALQDIAIWLMRNEVLNAHDIREVDKSNIFTKTIPRYEFNPQDYLTRL